MAGSIDIERVVAEQAKGVSDALKRAANSSETEADFRGQAARIFSAAAEHAGIDLSQRDEHTVASGRVDSVYNRLIIEYKRPGILKANNASATNQKVLEQIRRYVTDLAKKEKRSLQRFVGVALDGRLLIFVRPNGDVLRPDDPAAVSPASVVNAD